MDQDSSFSVTVKKDKFVIEVDRTLFDAEALTEFLTYLRIESVRNKSKATQADVDELARDVNRTVWQRLKPSVLPELESAAPHNG